MPIDYHLLEQHCRDAEVQKVIEQLRSRNDLEPINAEELTRIVALITPLYELETNTKRKKDYKTILELLKNVAVFDYDALREHIKEANLVAIKQLFLRHNNILLIDQEKLKASARLIKTEYLSEADVERRAIYEEILHILENGVITLPQTNSASREKLRVYVDRKIASKAEAISQKMVSDRFWRVSPDKPLKEGSPSDILYRCMHQELLKSTSERRPIVLDGYSFRALILALVKIFPQNIGYHNDPGCPLLKFSIGESILVCDPAGTEDGKESQVANHWIRVEQLPGERFTYGRWQTTAKQGVYNYLSNLCGDLHDANRGLREQQLAICLREKSRIIASFSETDFNEHFLIKIPGEPHFSLGRFRTESQKTNAQSNLASKIHYLNGLLFLYSECEVARRLYRTSAGMVFSYPYHNSPAAPKASDQIPMGILQARSLELLAQGIISLNDLFGHSTETYGETTEWVEKKSRYGTYKEPASGDALHRAEYGVATGKSTIKHLKIMQQKAAKVNQTTETRVIRNLQTFFEDIDPSLEKVRLPIKEGRNKLKMFLGRHYGGLYDGNSSGEDYSDDDIDNLGQSMSGLKIDRK